VTEVEAVQPSVRQGLTEAEVAERRATGRVNDIPDPRSRTVGQILRGNLFTPFNFLLGGLLLVIIAVGPLNDALFGGVLIANALIGIIQELRAKHTLDTLAVLSSPRALVLRDGVSKEIAIDEVVLDEVLELRPGDEVVVDGRILESSGLEVDEGLLPTAVEAVRPAVVTLLNLSRDQLDRIGEVRIHAEAWRRTLDTAPGAAVIANVDDPLVAWAAGAAPRVTWVGTGQRWRSDAAACPACGGRIQWEPEAATAMDAAVRGGAAWACSSCGFARPEPDLWLEGHELVSTDGHRHPIRLQLPGWCNLANACMAAAGAVSLGVEPSEAVAAMGKVGTVAGRYEVVDVDGVAVRLLLAKNPAGWAETLQLIRPAPLPVVVGINSRVADGRDPSWLWDVPFEQLRGRLVIATGERGRDLAVRLGYADVEHRFVADYRDAVATATDGAAEIDLAANYTSFQDARKALGHTSSRQTARPRARAALRAGGRARG